MSISETTPPLTQEDLLRNLQQASDLLGSLVREESGYIERMYPCWGGEAPAPYKGMLEQRLGCLRAQIREAHRAISYWNEQMNLHNQNETKKEQQPMEKQQVTDYDEWLKERPKAEKTSLFELPLFYGESLSELTDLRYDRHQNAPEGDLDVETHLDALGLSHDLLTLLGRLDTGLCKSNNLHATVERHHGRIWQALRTQALPFWRRVPGPWMSRKEAKKLLAQHLQSADKLDQVSSTQAALIDMQRGYVENIRAAMSCVEGYLVDALPINPTAAQVTAVWDHTGIRYNDSLYEDFFGALGKMLPEGHVAWLKTRCAAGVMASPEEIQEVLQTIVDMTQAAALTLAGYAPTDVEQLKVLEHIPNGIIKDRSLGVTCALEGSQEGLSGEVKEALWKNLDILYTYMKHNAFYIPPDMQELWEAILQWHSDDQTGNGKFYRQTWENKALLYEAPAECSVELQVACALLRQYQEALTRYKLYEGAKPVAIQ